MILSLNTISLSLDFLIVTFPNRMTDFMNFLIIYSQHPLALPGSPNKYFIETVSYCQLFSSMFENKIFIKSDHNVDFHVETSTFMSQNVDSVVKM